MKYRTSVISILKYLSMNIIRALLLWNNRTWTKIIFCSPVHLTLDSAHQKAPWGALMGSDTSLDLFEGEACAQSPLSSYVWWKTYFRFCTAMFIGASSKSAPTLIKCCEALFALQRMEISQQPFMFWQCLARLHSPMSVASSLVQWVVSDVHSLLAQQKYLLTLNQFLLWHLKAQLPLKA